MLEVPNNPSLTFLYCAESGYFEELTILSIESLRRFGGRFANSPVLVVTPRFGPGLTDKTLRRFNELGVTYIRPDIRHPLSWYVYMNKALGLLVQWH